LLFCVAYIYALERRLYDSLQVNEFVAHCFLV
jgi:hypothetical protein